MWVEFCAKQTVVCLYQEVFITLVFPLPQRGLRNDLGVPALLLEVSTTVPSVGVLAEPLARLVVDALGVSDGGSEAATRTHTDSYRSG